FLVRGRARDQAVDCRARNAARADGGCVLARAGGGDRDSVDRVSSPVAAHPAVGARGDRSLRVPRAPRRRRLLPILRRRRIDAGVASVVLAGAAVSAPRVLRSATLDQMFRARAVMEQLGPLGYHAYDAWNYARSTWLRPPATEAQVMEARAWFRDRAPLRAPG